MTKINSLIDFNNVASNITSFSHAYLLNVNSLKVSFPYAKEFAKLIILQDVPIDSFDYEDISYKIDNDVFDDLYVVNPDTLGINTEEINKLLLYMETKSLRENGRRVYIIYGFERLSRDISNKILKFLEEPQNNIYAILLTENFERILPTIVSRCQVLTFSFPICDVDENRINVMKDFLVKIFGIKKQTIAYENDFFSDIFSNRLEFFESFEILETIISNSLNANYGVYVDNKYLLKEVSLLPSLVTINILSITSKLKCLIKGNINLNLLLDRYIIEVAEELDLCKK